MDKVLPANQPRRNMASTYILIALTILFTVGGQLLVKAGMDKVGGFPSQVKSFLPYLWKAFTNWKVFLGLVFAIIASICWMGAVAKTDISFAYPFMALAIVLVLAFSPVLFKESIKWTQWVGVATVCIGLIITTR
jgi:drug/metabolite transporter (DMT)-like permease